MALVASSAGRFAGVLDSRRDKRILTVAVVSAGAADVHAVTRSRDPDRAVVGRAVADGVVAGSLVSRAFFSACAHVPGVVFSLILGIEMVLAALLDIHLRELVPAHLAAGWRLGDVLVLEGAEGSDGAVEGLYLAVPLEDDIGAIVIERIAGESVYTRVEWTVGKL